MLRILAPRGAGKSTFVKARPTYEHELLPLHPGEQIQREIVHLYDADELPEVKGVYRKMEEEFGSLWTSFEMARLKRDSLLRHAVGNLSKRLGNSSIVFSNQEAFVGAPVDTVVVLPSFQQFKQNHVKRALEKRSLEFLEGEALVKEWTDFLNMTREYKLYIARTFEEAIVELEIMCDSREAWRSHE